MKNIEFRGQSLTVEEARKMVAELIAALAQADPVITDSPVGQPMAALVDPRWYVEPAQLSTGSLICFRDPGLGWRAFILPWGEVAGLIRLLSRQMAAAAGAHSAVPHDASKIH